MILFITKRWWRKCFIVEQRVRVTVNTVACIAEGMFGVFVLPARAVFVFPVQRVIRMILWLR
jgi:hypothetical protein